ncbi:hypothetical protein CGMCC3_g17179 [Colletotrichum fructicola]|nr:uncharacterized protein CGMCC3_g17179 [Colletotrichum fructicola]KAE9566685.1 hypothetical protein CGMCC3_g17179 [Colletotrichum fructicola]
MESLVWHGTRKDIDKDTSATPWSRNTILLRLILRQRPGENEQWRRILPDDVLVDGSTPDMLKSLKKLDAMGGRWTRPQHVAAGVVLVRCDHVRGQRGDVARQEHEIHVSRRNVHQAAGLAGGYSQIRP